MSAVSVGGMFSLGFNQIVGLLVPLYLVAIGQSVLWIGVILSARSALSFLYAIQLGRIIDLIGARRAMLVFSSLGVVVSLLYPLVRQAQLLIVLQLLCGMVAAMCWMSSQAAVTRLTGGEARPMAIFSFFASLGNFIGPLLAGWAWDTGGTWPAFLFMSGWLCCMVVAALALPAERSGASRAELGVLLFLPNPRSYLGALKLLRIPQVRFVMGVTFARMAAIVMQESFYAVLLGSKGYPAVTIGILVALGWLVSTPAALLTPMAVRLLKSEDRVLQLSTAISILGIALTGVLDSFPALVFAVCLFGIGQGVGFSLVITGASRHLSGEDLGLSVGLRATVNRVAGFVLPLIMGGVAHWTGVGAAFLIVGAAMLAALYWIGLLAKGAAPR